VVYSDILIAVLDGGYLYITGRGFLRIEEVSSG
jgi:hypothetical protein